MHVWMSRQEAEQQQRERLLHGSYGTVGRQHCAAGQGWCGVLQGKWLTRAFITAHSDSHVTVVEHAG